MKHLKKLTLFLCLTLLSASLLTGCGAAREEPETASDIAADAETENSDQTASEAETNETLSETETELSETSTEAETEETENAEATQEGSETAENIRFTVDVTDNLTGTENLIIGNTAGPDVYSGAIEIHLHDSLLARADEIKPGNTYVFTVGPMMTMSIPPQVSATDFVPASEADIEALEDARRKISNFKECMEQYWSMSEDPNFLENVIADANFNYPVWTQEEIAEYNAFLIENGYTGDSGIISYVKLRDELNGSIFGDSYEN